jgi:hypothetical protein
MRNNIITAYKIVISAAVFLVFMTPALVLAQPVSAPIPVRDASADAAGIGGGTALNWAGYVSDSGTYTSVSGSWVIPTVANQDGSSADATWVGIGGVLSHDLIQAGTEAVPDSNGGIDYQAWYELLPSGSVTVPLTVHAGDSMTATITEQSGAADTWLITIADVTTGKSYSTTVNYASSLSSAEWIEEMPAGVGTRISLDDFGTVQFTGGMTTKDGSSVSIAGSGAVSLTMANDADQPLAIPSVLGGDGESFSVARTGAASNSIGIGAFGIGGSGHGMPAGAGSQYYGYGTRYDTGTTTQITPNISISYGTVPGSGIGTVTRYHMSRSYTRSYSIDDGNGVIRVFINGYAGY